MPGMVLERPGGFMDRMPVGGVLSGEAIGKGGQLSPSTLGRLETVHFAEARWLKRTSPEPCGYYSLDLT